MEILFFVILGLLVLGPKRLHATLGHAARAKAKFEDATRDLQSQLAELEALQKEEEVHGQETRTDSFSLRASSKEKWEGDRP